MITRLSVDNYKCLVNFELPLTELTLLLGPNGVGKSAVLEVVFALRQLLSGVAKFTNEIFPPRSLTRWQSRPVQIIELETELYGVRMTYRLEVERNPGGFAQVGLERLALPSGPLFEFRGGEVQLYSDDHEKGLTLRSDSSESALARFASSSGSRHVARFLGFMRKILVCSLYPPSYKAESRSEDVLLHRDGRNFAAWYRHISQERADLVPDFNAALREVLEGFKGIRLERVGQEARALMAVFEEGQERFELRLDELSDGQRVLMALYALVHITIGQGYTLFLDEPDNYLALPEIQPWLIALADACGNTVPQAVVCSHHPELIDYLGNDCGLLLERDSGLVKVRRPDTRAVEGGLKLSEIVARGWER